MRERSSGVLQIQFGRTEYLQALRLVTTEVHCSTAITLVAVDAKQHWRCRKPEEISESSNNESFDTPSPESRSD